jgi:hypothetical protein
VANAPAELVLPGPEEIRSTLRGSGPRLARDALGPLAAFYAGWKLLSLGAGIAAAIVLGLAVFAHERRQQRPAVVVRLALVLVAIRATVGIVSGSGRAYLATEVGIDSALALAVLGSLAGERPFASWFTSDVYPLPGVVLESQIYRRTMRRITLAWGIYFLLRGLVRLAALLTLSTDSYAVVVALTDAPFLLALLAWSVYYSLRTFRASEEIGLLIAAAPGGPT